MNTFRFCTFTGVDQFTDIERLKDLSQGKIVEWGFLFSKGRQGVENRYPEISWLREISKDFKTFPENTQFALHVCGTAYVIDLLTNSASDKFDELFEIAKHFNRVQLNFNGKIALKKGVSAEHFSRLTQKLKGINPDFYGIIVQNNTNNAPLLEEALRSQVMSGFLQYSKNLSNYN